MVPDLEGLPVVDSHIHINRYDLAHEGARAVLASNPGFTTVERFAADPAAFLAHMDAEGIAQAWLINYRAEEVMGYTAAVNEWAGTYCQADPQRLVAIGGYDPKRDGPGREHVVSLAASGVRGLKLHTVHQHLYPDDHRGDEDGLAAAYAELERRRMPLLIHTNTLRRVPSSLTMTVSLRSTLCSCILAQTGSLSGVILRRLGGFPLKLTTPLTVPPSPRGVGDTGSGDVRAGMVT